MKSLPKIGATTNLKAVPRVSLNKTNDGSFFSYFTMATVAYSLRKLNDAYNGSCLEVRRSSDNTVLDIGFVSGLIDLQTLIDFVGTSSGFVSKWYDQTDNNFTVNQATLAQQPRIVLNGVLETFNNNPCITFDISTVSLASASTIFNNSALSIFFSTGSFSSSSESVLGERESLSGWGVRPYHSTTQMITYNAARQVAFFTMPVADLNNYRNNGLVGSAFRNSSFNWVNGIQNWFNKDINYYSVESGTLGYVSTAAKFRIGSDIDVVNSSFFGKVFEVIIYNQFLPELRDEATANLQRFYKL